MLKPICVSCERFYRPKKTGRYFVEGFPTHNEAKKGKAEPESWRPYKLWMGDEWECPDCGSLIIVGTGLQHIAEHYQPKFKAMVENSPGSDLLIKDC